MNNLLDAAPPAPDLFLTGEQHLQAGRLDEAEAIFWRLLADDPKQPDVLHALGTASYQRGRMEPGVGLIRQAILQRGDRALYHGNLAVGLRALGRLSEAEAACRTAVHHDPGYVEAWNRLGLILRSLDRKSEAVAAFRESLRLRPTYIEAQHNLGNVLTDLQRLDEAEACYRSTLELTPKHPQVMANLAATLWQQEKLAEAESCFRQALRLNPRLAEAQYGLANVLAAIGADKEAETHFRTAIELDPKHDRASFNLAHLLLSRGDLEEGWRLFETRKQVYGAGIRECPQPLWAGEALAGRTLLVHAEQGLGDTLQFCRYLPMLAQLDGRIVFQVQAPLYRLIERMMGDAVGLVSFSSPVPEFDLHVPLLSVPRLLGTTLANIPAEMPYLTPDPAAVAGWRGRLAAYEGLRVGLVWAGGARPHQPELAPVDGRRSMKLERLAPLGGVRGVTFVSLQKGPPAEQAAHPPAGMVLHDFTNELRDFADTADLVAALDLVIGVDTSTLHLAGALGKPVWLLNRFDSCWRWLKARDDSPWYPTLRQFRQPAPYAWEPVIERVAATLAALARSRRDPVRLGSVAAE